jgi:hypothetical protein
LASTCVTGEVEDTTQQQQQRSLPVKKNGSEKKLQEKLFETLQTLVFLEEK